MSRAGEIVAEGERVIHPARASQLVAQLFGSDVAAAELREVADASLLHPDEAAFCSGFAPQRIADFTAGRLCARRALADLGIADFPLGVNADRSPRWPPGIAGSISHTSGYACAVAAHAANVGGIGVDAEIVGRVTPDLDRLIFTSREADFLATLSDAERARAATIIFSAKEAFYKCQFPLTHRWLDFRDASLELTTSDLRSGTFVVETAYELLGLPDARLPLQGRFRVDGGIAVTGITLFQPADSPSPAANTSANAAAASSRSTR